MVLEKVVNNISYLRLLAVNSAPITALVEPHGIKRMETKMYVLMVLMNFTDADACQAMADKYYPDEDVKCTMFIRHLPPYMPAPLNRPEMWSCKYRPTLCLKPEQD